LHDRWINVVFRIKDSQKTVKFKDIVDFVKAEAKKANDPTYGKSAMNYSRNKSNSSSNFVSVFRIVGHSKAFLINADAITSVSP
jgi:hypothetical protein